VRRSAVDLAVLLGIGTVFAVYLALSEPGWRNIVAHVYVLFLGSLILYGLLATMRDRAPANRHSLFDAALAEPHERSRALPELEKVMREVSLSTVSGYDFHVRLLPQLREIAQMQLERSGRRPGPETLGRWWELLRADQPIPEERFGNGVSRSELRALVSDLEKM
jgi:hypothetical protein